MKRLCRCIILASTLALAAAPLPARADFYSLEGRFQCLDRPGAICFDATKPPPEPTVAPPPDARESRNSPVAAAPKIETEVIAPPVAPPDPVLVIARQIARERPEEGDLDRLRRAAQAGDARAVELLAWCALRGIGTGRDPVEAYRLYGKAAALSVPRARENQALVFERTLTSAERQHVLELDARSQRTPGALAAGGPPTLR